MLFELNREECVRCGLCVRDCAFGALRTDDSNYPTLANPTRCMRCQHCFAICPKGAITFDGFKAQDSLRVRELNLPTAEQVEHFIRSRRSMRHFKDADPDAAVIDRILRTLGNSPTGCNARGLTFTCYANRESMNAFRGRFLRAIEEHREGAKLLPRWLAVPAIKLRQGKSDMFFRGAPAMVIISSDETTPGVTTPNEDIAAAVTYFELLANANGLATCWCGFLRLVQKEIPELLEKAAGIRQTTPFYAMLFGLPAVTYTRTVQRDTYAWIVYK